MSNCKITKEHNAFIVADNDQNEQVNVAWLPQRPKGLYESMQVLNVLQYLTSMEADLALLNYFRALIVGGSIEITVPDADFYMRKWMQVDWTEEMIRDANSDCRLAFAGLWGEQNSGNPRNDNYSNKHIDVFKSAYNSKRLTFLLERAGFVDVNVIDNGAGLLTAAAFKSMNKSERQVATHINQVRQDHKNRYQFACDVLSRLDINTVLDCACGIGYGSLMLSNATGAKVTGIDIDAGAIDYARKYFCNENTSFVCEDARTLVKPDNSFDAVISFETIEHISFAKELVTFFYDCLTPGGYFICSTPNQDVMPFCKDKFPYHIKHFTNVELVTLLQSAGFQKIELYKQSDYEAGSVEPGDDGCFTIAVAKK